MDPLQGYIIALIVGSIVYITYVVKQLSPHFSIPGLNHFKKPRSPNLKEQKTGGSPKVIQENIPQGSNPFIQAVKSWGKKLRKRKK